MLLRDNVLYLVSDKWLVLLMDVAVFAPVPRPLPDS